jgi:fumarate hydratase subunit alpha
MREVNSRLIEKTVTELSIKANTLLRKDVIFALKKCYEKERNVRAKEIFKALLKNAEIARNKKLAICQDTGFPIVFIELGQEVHIKGNIKEAVNRGIEKGYRYGFLRKSIVLDPLKRGEPKYGPAVIHIDLIKGEKIKISLLPKGFGCENKAKVKMFNPTVELDSIKDFVISAVKEAGANACPPYIIGIGIGGTQDYACLLAKKALLKKITLTKKREGVNKLRHELLTEINKLDIGPMGLGGRVTVLGVNIETSPTHIAGLPVCVNISCHALRSATKII